MKKIFSKNVIRVFLLAGSLFAIGMAGLDFLGGDVFNPWKFVYHFLFFGIFMTVGINFVGKKKSKSDVREK